MLHAYWGSGAEQRTLRPPHEAGHRAAKRLLVELIISSVPLQKLRRGATAVGLELMTASMQHDELRRGTAVALEGGVGPGAAEPLRDVEVTPQASVVQWRISIVGGVERGARTSMQPLSEVEVTL